MQDKFRQVNMEREAALSRLRDIGPVRLACRDVATELVREALTQQAAGGWAMANARLFNTRAWFRLWAPGVPWERFWPASLSPTWRARRISRWRCSAARAAASCSS